CCNYLTKQQKRVDYQVAVAALKICEERERNESLPLGEHDGFTLARGSYCYSSCACTLLPLGDAIRQLTISDEYSCRLVNASADQTEPKFQAVSFLDGYIFRPDELENVNLYEFTMCYFQTKNDNGSSKLGFIDGRPLAPIGWGKGTSLLFL
ncbi:hypothetical protein JG688_00015553, partial [Phytophthora aleatoria]